MPSRIKGLPEITISFRFYRTVYGTVDLNQDMTLTEKYERLHQECADAGARLVVVSKTHPVACIRELYDAGHRVFGENRVAELLDKQAALPDDIEWHFIGHLQRKKAKNLLPVVSVVHSGDSLPLLRELDKRASERSIDVLLQFHIAEENSKYGLERSAIPELMAALAEQPLTHVRLTGVMGMATYTDSEEQVATEFRELHEIFTELKQNYFADDPAFAEISMGMSGDYRTALRQGSTLVRVGSLLFGERKG